MVKSKFSFQETIKWSVFQFLLFLVFLFLFYSLETRNLDSMSKVGVNQRLAIQDFLNHLQFSFLPDLFFILFPPLLLISVSLIFFCKWRWLFLSLTGTGLSILFIADRIYYRFFASVVSFSSTNFTTFSHAWVFKSSVFSSLKISDLFYLAVFLIFPVLGQVYNKNMKNRLSENPLSFTIDKLFGIIFFLIAIYAFNIAFYLPKRHVMLDNHHQLKISTKPFKNKNQYLLPNYQISNRFYASTFGFMNYHFVDLVKIFIPETQAHKMTTVEESELSSFYNEKNKINQTRSPFWGIAKNRNIFLIHFESLLPMLIGLTIDNTQITPTLNNLAESHLFWENILDQTKLAASSDAEFMVMTGMLPNSHDIVAFDPEIKKHLHALPRTLKSKGYGTISLHGFNSSFWLRNINHPIYGFDTMYFDNVFSSEEKIGWGLPDKNFFSQSVDLLLNHSSPFIAYLISLSTHHPYKNIPESYQKLFSKSISADSMLIRYLQLIRYTDDALGEFFSKLKDNNLWDNSIFVIYGDHPPEMDETGVNTLQKISGKYLYDPRNQCVPILIVIPGEEGFSLKHRQAYTDTVGGLNDVYPTILHLLGFDIPPGIYGNHLFVLNDQRDVLPSVKYLDRFAYNGILYQDNGRMPYEDKFGIVFSGDKKAVINDEIKRVEAYKKALYFFKLHNYIFYPDFNFDVINNLQINAAPSEDGVIPERQQAW